MKEPKNILLVRTDRIGDVVLSLPMAEIIKRHFPNSKVSFLLRNYTKALADNNPFIDEILILHEENGEELMNENIELLKNKNFDTCFVVHPTLRMAAILFLSGIKKRIGTGYRWYSFLFNKKIFEHRKYGTDHELHHNLNMLRKIGISESVNEENVSFNIHPSPESIQKVEDLLNRNKIDTSIANVIIHPGSGGSAVDLPISTFKEVVSLLARELKLNILITGSESEKKLCEEFIVNERTYNLAGKFNLEELIAVINKSKIMIANSTGPIHIAAALGKSVVGFYPKIASCSQKRWGPYTNKKVIFEPVIECQNCTKKQCSELNCMSSISAQDIFNSIKEMLS